MSERELSDRSANMKIRPTYTLALALTVLLLLPGAAWSLEKVRLGYSGVGSGEEIHHFAKEVGLFSKAGLDVEIIYIPGGSTVVQAIAAGEIQFGRGSATEVVTAHMAGFPLKILAALINKFVYSFVTPATITKPQDLKGKAVAVSRFGSGSDFITRLALKSWGLEPAKDVTILQVGNSPERLAAIASGKVHGSILSLSQTPRAKKLGLRVLADLSQIDAEYPQGVLYVPVTLIEKRPDLIRTFLAAYVEGIRQFKTNKQAAYAVIARSSGLKDKAEIEEYHALLTKNFLLDYPMPTVPGIKTVLEDLAVRNPKVREIKPEDLLETRFLRELKESGAMR
jgi:NitT/TauT family transport system substrate-binding protein